MLFLTVLALIVFLIFPSLCQVYGLIVGGSLFFSGIGALFSIFSPTEAAYSVDLDLSFEHLPFFILGNPALSKFCLGWGLLVAGHRGRSAVGYTLGALNVLGAALGLFYIDSGTALTLPGGWSKVLSILVSLGLGLTTVSVILNSWSSQATAADDGTEPKKTAN
jgi:hypothetical protein